MSQLYVSPQWVWDFVIEGAPRTKKNHSRIFKNQKTGCRFVMPSKQSAAWTMTAVKQLTKQRWRLGGYQWFPIEIPVQVTATFYRDRAVGDLVNYMQALADALQAARVIADDKWITSWDGTRLAKDAKRPRVELEISTVAS